MIDIYSQEADKELVFTNLFEVVKKIFTEKKDEWIAKHVAFDLRDKFDYRGKIKPCIKQKERAMMKLMR